MEIKKAIPYGILIEPTANNGFYVKIGCARLSFENKGSLKEFFSEFLDHPEEMEKAYNLTFAGTLVAGPDRARNTHRGLVPPEAGKAA